MAPSLIVLLRELLSEQQREHIYALLYTLATNVTRSEQGYEMQPKLGSWHLWGFRNSLIGATAEELQSLGSGMGVHVAVGMMGELYDLEQEAPQYLEAVGYIPQQCIVCDATNITPIHHRLLGNVAYALAARLDGLIGFTYPALPPVHPERFTRLTQSFPESPDRSPRPLSSNKRDQENGQVFEIYLDPEYADPNRYYTVVDAPYFLHLLKQPKIWLGD